jgi:hypothetical protein
VIFDHSNIRTNDATFTGAYRSLAISGSTLSFSTSLELAGESNLVAMKILVKEILMCCL